MHKDEQCTLPKGILRAQYEHACNQLSFNLPALDQNDKIKKGIYESTYMNIEYCP